eukprot:SAG31_NODE_16861_length_692_cov_1.843170_2_plen_28_part_01
MVILGNLVPILLVFCTIIYPRTQLVFFK